MEELSDGDDAPSANYSAPRSRPTPVRPARPQGVAPVEQEEPKVESNGQSEAPAKSGGRGTRGSQKARKSQVDLLKTLAVEWRGENGVERLEGRIGKPLTDLTRIEADDWIDRLTPEDQDKKGWLAGPSGPSFSPPFCCSPLPCGFANAGTSPPPAGALAVSFIDVQSHPSLENLTVY